MEEIILEEIITANPVNDVLTFCMLCALVIIFCDAMLEVFKKLLVMALHMFDGFDVSIFETNKINLFKFKKVKAGDD